LEVLYRSTPQIKMESIPAEVNNGWNNGNRTAHIFSLITESQKACVETPMVNQENALRKYKKFEPLQNKSVLVEKYSYLVKFCVRRMGMFLPPHVEQDDLMSEGIIGLIDAIEKYNPEKGADFPTYATLRIRGAIIDSLRQKDWIPRNIRELAKDIDKAKMRLENDKGRTPTLDELAEHMQMSPNKLSYHMNKIKNAEVVSLDEMVKLSGSFESNLSQPHREESESVEAEVEKKERIEILKVALGTLKPREKLILSLYYYEELTLKEIQQILGISMPRISQIHKNVLKKLKETLKDKKDILVL
jgi:RNA polymerase sigma factor FliA